MADEDRKLETVAMPIVLMMAAPNLSWESREACAEALRMTLEHYQSLSVAEG